MKKKENKRKLKLAKDHNVITSNNFSKEKEHEKTVYIDYKTRLLISLMTVLLLSVITIILTNLTLNLSNMNRINYREKSNIDYKVYLKENNFYENEYLEKDKVYVASLIDKILIDFKYDFDIEKENDLAFKYDVIAKLSINDETTGSNYYEKEYELISLKQVKINNQKQFNLKEQIDINYSYYNLLANTFRQQYGIDTLSNLNVYLRVYKEEDNSNFSTMYVKIPLSEKSVNIELDYQDINNSSYLIKTENNYIKYITLILSILFFTVLLAINLLKFIRLLLLMRDKKTPYDKYIDKILNEYDRLIVESKTEPDLKNSNIIKMPKFSELLDVRDNLKLPIMYYVVVKHHKSYFYIKNNKDIYLLINKSADLEKSKYEK